MAVLPTLTAWASSHLAGILQSKTEDAFNAAFDDTFAAVSEFALNGKTLSRDEYKAVLLQQSAAGFGEASTTVTFQGATEVETDDQGELSGLVGLFYTALSDSVFLILGAPAERRDTSSINLVIKPTEKRPENPKPPTRGYFDPRRVVAIDQVTAETTFHVAVPKSAIPQSGASGFKSEVGGPLQLPQNHDAKHRGWITGLNSGFGGLFEPGPEISLPPT